MRKSFKAFVFAWRGIIISIKSERNLRFHLFVAIAVTITGFIFKISPAEWMIQTFAIGLVISAELINTSIEYLTDLVSPEKHETAEKVKDIAAGAVLIVAITALVLGLMIYLPIIFKFF